MLPHSLMHGLLRFALERKRFAFVAGNDDRNIP
jgi:hypothetical protein